MFGLCLAICSSTLWSLSLRLLFCGMDTSTHWTVQSTLRFNVKPVIVFMLWFCVILPCMTLWWRALVLASRPGRPRAIRGFRGFQGADHKVMHSCSLLCTVCTVSREDHETRAEVLATCASYYVKVSVWKNSYHHRIKLIIDAHIHVKELWPCKYKLCLHLIIGLCCRMPCSHY